MGIFRSEKENGEKSGGRVGAFRCKGKGTGGVGKEFTYKDLSATAN